MDAATPPVRNGDRIDDGPPLHRVHPYDPEGIGCGTSLAIEGSRTPERPTRAQSYPTSVGASFDQTEARSADSRMVGEMQMGQTKLGLTGEEIIARPASGDSGSNVGDEHRAVRDVP